MSIRARIPENSSAIVDNVKEQRFESAVASSFPRRENMAGKAGHNASKMGRRWAHFEAKRTLSLVNLSHEDRGVSTLAHRRVGRGNGEGASQQLPVNSTTSGAVVGVQSVSDQADSHVVPILLTYG